MTPVPVDRKYTAVEPEVVTTFKARDGTKCSSRQEAITRNARSNLIDLVKETLLDGRFKREVTSDDVLAFIFRYGREIVRNLEHVDPCVTNTDD